MKRAYDFRMTARDSLRGLWAPVIGVSFLAFLAGAEITMSTSFVYTLLNIADESIWVFAINIIRLAVGSLVSLGLIQYNLNLIDKKPAYWNQLFCHTSIWGKAIWLKLRAGIFIFLWTLLLIIPGIIKSYSYSMAGFIMSENPEISAKEAMEMSMKMMNGNKFRLFCLRLSFVGWFILGILTLGIGFLWIIPYMNSATAAFYDDVSRNTNVNE